MDTISTGHRRLFLHIHTLSRFQRLTSQWKNRYYLYTKPTDKHQYLLHSSCHPIHSKRAIPFSLALRLRRICSTSETFTLRTNELIDYFLQREIQRVNSITRTECSLCYHLKPSCPSFHLIHYSQTLSHPYFIPPLL